MSEKKVKCGPVFSQLGIVREDLIMIMQRVRAASRDSLVPSILEEVDNLNAILKSPRAFENCRLSARELRAVLSAVGCDEHRLPPGYIDNYVNIAS